MMGVRPNADAFATVTSCVPPLVPSVTNSSRPVAVSPLNSACEPRLVISVGCRPPAIPEVSSLVPAAVPSVDQS